MKYIIKKEQTLLEALTEFASCSSKNTLRDWLKKDRVAVDGKLQKVGSTIVLPDQLITVQDKAKITKSGEIRVVYQDQHIIAIEKPSGLLSVATVFDASHTAHCFLKKSLKPKKVQVVHRLDQDTSGVMIFALSDDAYVVLKKMFEKHELERAYTAIVEGKLDESAGTWESYLVEDVNYVVRETNDLTLGRIAITHFRATSSARNYTALELKLETGRKNQIRVHCQSAGHPIVGDKKYGSTSNPAKRLCLHAHLLAFEHPITKKPMRFESPLPLEMKNLVTKHA